MIVCGICGQPQTVCRAPCARARAVAEREWWTDALAVALDNVRRGRLPVRFVIEYDGARPERLEYAYPMVQLT